MSSVSIKHEEIRKLIGCKYKVHGRSREEGFDCYGIGIEVYKIHDRYLPDVNYEKPEQYESVFLEQQNKVCFIKVKHPTELTIIVFKVREEPTHMGIYLGDGLFIHSTKYKGVIVEPLHRWEKRVEGYYECISKNN